MSIARNPLERPAEYYVQVPDATVNTGYGIGIEVRLTGVSRAGRTPKQFHEALAALHGLVKQTVSTALLTAGSPEKVQIFVAIMIDGDVPGKPGSTTYSNVLESEAEWVEVGQAA